MRLKPYMSLPAGFRGFGGGLRQVARLGNRIACCRSPLPAPKNITRFQKPTKSISRKRNRKRT
ncbi:hypothetical protein B296_00054421 [Ensete ventricosum]|uniref:Uncharacterized protein n=1 Tax=Ensete ventricosum TaxID=4639 RepID=A0A426X9V0_ENSVE|nr:hypothetical protein B296_00054421 [Ensete ventricosum]